MKSTNEIFNKTRARTKIKQNQPKINIQCFGPTFSHKKKKNNQPLSLILPSCVDVPICLFFTFVISVTLESSQTPGQ